MRVSVVATGIDIEAQDERGAGRNTAVAEMAARVAAPDAGKGSAPEPASAAFPNPAAGPVGSDPGKVKLRFDSDARPSAGPLFASRAARRSEPALVFVKAVSVKAANGDARRGRRPSLAAPDPAERILPNGTDRKPPSVTRLPRH